MFQEKQNFGSFSKVRNLSSEEMRNILINDFHYPEENVFSEMYDMRRYYSSCGRTKAYEKGIYFYKWID